MNPERPLARLQHHLSHLKRVAVAFSGGVDSTLLLRVACDTLGKDQVVALTACTELVPRREQQEAEELARKLGVRHERLHEQVLSFRAVASNPRDRCYHCKHLLFTLFRKRCDELGYTHLVDGTNSDDLGEDRPGLKALKELQVKSPLAESGLSKQNVRELSRKLGLPTAEQPAFACLASRIPFGTVLTAENLSRVERCEDFLRDHGFHNVRVRYHDTIARIELENEDMQRIMEPSLSRELVERFREYGFTYVTLDLQGFRSGSMSEV